MPALVLALLLAPGVCLGSETPRTICLDDRPVLAPAGPWHVALEGGAGIGVFFTHHGRVGLAVGRTFFHRVELALTLHYGSGTNLASHEESVRVGLLLHLARRLDVMMGWRVGHAGFYIPMPGETLRTESLVASVLGELRYALSPSFELRVAPFVGTGYWNGLWALSLEPYAGLAWRF